VLWRKLECLYYCNHKHNGMFSMKKKIHKEYMLTVNTCCYEVFWRVSYNVKVLYILHIKTVQLRVIVGVLCLCVCACVFVCARDRERGSEWKVLWSLVHSESGSILLYRVGHNWLDKFNNMLWQYRKASDRKPRTQYEEIHQVNR
jgi:hypothetical protein